MMPTASFKPQDANGGVSHVYKAIPGVARVGESRAGPRGELKEPNLGIGFLAFAMISCNSNHGFGDIVRRRSESLTWAFVC
ncbi:hypothetical protein FOPG_16692 [Fusarium oxysporum f. sp. conglutinans race 2 54008]|uniref:Uncharacterized protein n=1 Tax=Fusarium oxysporum f. sp. conglutinans race 2 54008 TaxID=1089457 RepID=X0H5C9_FUSOX|nr:hypothetical protein FOPG_16692 [Fusarium oxysporum f. sp. conglutinans race 2 54008]